MILLHRLQDPKTVTGSVAQDLVQAVDVAAYPYVTVQVRKLGGSGGGSLWLQGAPVCDESAFFDLQSWVLSGMTKSTKVLNKPPRYLRWSTTSAGTDTLFLIDLLGRPATSPEAAWFVLQEPRTLTASGQQAISGAIDVLQFRTLVVEAQVFRAGVSAEQLVLQHAPVLDDDAFEDITSSDFSSSSTFDLTTTTSQVIRYVNVNRYVRWRGTRGAGATDPVFRLDVIARGC